MTNDSAQAYVLDDKQHDNTYKTIKTLVFRNALSVDRPEAVITGGQPASGKGWLARQAVDSFADKGKSVLIDPDTLRSFHPAYDSLMQHNDKKAADYTHHDASRWAASLLRDAMAEKKNIVLDQTSGDAVKLKSKIDNLRESGYEQVQLHVMAVSPMISRQGIYTRYEGEKSVAIASGEGGGRFVPVDVHNKAYEGLLKAVDDADKGQWVDRLVISDRQYNVLLDQNKTPLKDANKLIAAQTLLSEQNKVLSEPEKLKHDAVWTLITEKMQSRKAPFLEIAEVERLQEQDRKALGLVKATLTIDDLDPTEKAKLAVLRRIKEDSIKDKPEPTKQKEMMDFDARLQRGLSDGSIRPVLAKIPDPQVEKYVQSEKLVVSPTDDKNKNLDR
jgi:hypothetical protein